MVDKIKVIDQLEFSTLEQSINDKEKNIEL